MLLFLIALLSGNVLAERAQIELHHLYSVEGAWHLSHDDDAVSSFQLTEAQSLLP